VKIRSMLAVALLALVPLAACGDDADDQVVSDDTSNDPSDETTETTAAPDDVPQAIVSLSPTSTEMLFAIGAGDQVVAVDDQSDHPEDAPITDLSSYEPNVEAIASYDPDLVVASSDDAALVDGLEALDIEVLVHPAAVVLDDVWAQIEELGTVTGHEEEANELSAGLQAEVNQLADTAGDWDLTAYWELDPTFYSVTSSTFIGSLLQLAGITSIADDAEAEAGDYPQLSPEFIVQADPDLVFLADTECCEQSAEAVAGRDGWAGMQAVTNGNVVELSDDIASRWGPRVVDLLGQLVDAAEKAAS
jgi:iron complex transport system substrate-binding protein